MNIMNLGLNDWVTCPFDPVHRMKYSKFHNHFVKCRAKHPEDIRKPCPYNYSELIKPEEWDEHLISCAYRVLYATNHQSSEFRYYDAPCHFKFGPKSQHLKYNPEETDSVGSNDCDLEEIDSISTTGCMSVISDAEENNEQMLATETKNEQHVIEPSRVEIDKCENEKSVVLQLEKRGFGRGAFFRKLMNSNLT